MKWLDRKRSMRLFNARLELAESLGLGPGSDILSIRITLLGIVVKYRCIYTYLQCKKVFGWDMPQRELDQILSQMYIDKIWNEFYTGSNERHIETVEQICDILENYNNF